MSSLIVPVIKPLGKTPLQLIKAYRMTFPEHRDQKISFAGRLDPMAEGLMLLVVGDQTEKESLLHLDKVYEFTMLCGIKTDTFDILGIPQSHLVYAELDQNLLELVASKMKHIVEQTYPPYSSKTVNGISLFEYARKNLIHTITLPTRKVSIRNVKFLRASSVLGKNALQTIEERIHLVIGDFRQKSILDKWREVFNIYTEDHLNLYSFEIQCSSGTYIRSLVHDIGKELGMGAIAWNIKRTRVGKYTLEEGIILDF